MQPTFQVAERMLVLAHRGYHATAVENTQAAFAAAAALVVDGIETDVRLGGDGTAVLFHERRAPDGRLVAELTPAELGAAAGYEVPTLDDALKRWPDLLWNLEIKDPAAVQATVEAVSRRGAADRVLVSSFWHSVVAEACARLGTEGGLVIGHRPTAEGFSFAAPHPRITYVVCSYEFCDAETVAAATAVGLKCLVFGADCPDDVRRAASWQPAGIITDCPEAALASGEAV